MFKHRQSRQNIHRIVKTRWGWGVGKALMAWGGVTLKEVCELRVHVGDIRCESPSRGVGRGMRARVGDWVGA